MSQGARWNSEARGENICHLCVRSPENYIKAQRTKSHTLHQSPIGHLRNDLMTEMTFLTVERKESNSDGWLVVARDVFENHSGWLVVARDVDWETKLLWTRTNVVTGESNVQVKCHCNPNSPYDHHMNELNRYDPPKQLCQNNFKNQ